MEIMNYQEYSSEIEQQLAQRRDFFIEQEIETSVKEIINGVKSNGNSALSEYTARFDNVQLDKFRIENKEVEAAYNKVEDAFLNSLNKAVENVKAFHEKQLTNSWFDSSGGQIVGQKICPLKRVGAYVPGGTAPYPSSLVMTAVPALAAGVKEIAVTTPPGEEGRINPYILAAAREIGIEEIYKIGGAQAVAALAFGTETIKQVDKIVGPGNIYVTTAKKMVYGTVDIDMLAGPSELFILADESGRADYLAADLLSQAEHDPRSISGLITTSVKLAREVKKEVEDQLQDLPRKEIAASAWEEYGLIITTEDLEQGINLINEYAPEHFELVVKNPFSKLGKIKNAGAIFIGENSSEPLGDYLAGPNHVLPTGGTARFSSPLNTADFLKKSSIIYYGENEVKKEGEKASYLARLEGLEAHARAVEKRNTNQE